MKLKKWSIVLAGMLAVLFLGQSIQASFLPFQRHAKPTTVEVPVIMYHLITERSKYQGKFGISPEEMEADLKYLKENGYETIVVADLIKFVEKRKALPEKPILLTFDDGSNSDHTYLFPLLQKYDMKAVLSIVGKFTEDYSKDETKGKKPHLVWAQIKELHDSGLVEIQNHSYNLHGDRGSGKKKSESMDEYKVRLTADLSKTQQLIEENIHFTPTTFTYPLGINSKGSKEILQDMGFKATLSCQEGYATFNQGDSESLFNINRNIRRCGDPVEKILKRLEDKNKK